MNFTVIAVILVLCALFIFIVLPMLSRRQDGAGTSAPNAPAGRDRQTAKASPPEAKKAGAGVVSFPLTGTNLSGRQRALHMIDDSDDERYLCCTYGIERTEYQGAPAFKIYAELSDDDNTHKDLGLVPAERVSEVAEIYGRIFRVNVEVDGGQADRNYGATATLYYDK